MKYTAIINTDEPLTEQTIESIKDTLFSETSKRLTSPIKMEIKTDKEQEDDT